MSKVRIAVVGSGFGLYGLLPAFHSLDSFQVVAVCGGKTERMVTYCKKIGIPTIYTDWKEMLTQEHLDAVAIAVTPDAQYRIASYAIQKGINVFAEKPLTADYKKAFILSRLAKDYKVVHAVDFIFSEIASFLEVKDIINKNKYGKLQFIEAMWDFESYDIKNKKSSWKTDSKKGGGALSFYFSHVLYYLEYFAGKIKNVQSTFSYSKESRNWGETGVDTLLKFKNGARGFAHINCNSKGFNRHSVLLQFERGTVVLESPENTVDTFFLTIYSNGKVQKKRYAKQRIIEGEDVRVRYVRSIAKRFGKACQDGTQMYPNFNDGLRVEELIVKVRKSKL